MYYSTGNYEAFAKTEKPEGIENRHAFITGLGLSVLSTAVFLIRDGHMPGENIEIITHKEDIGASFEGFHKGGGYVVEGLREMDESYESLWDMLRSIPSIEHEGNSVLDDIYIINKKDPVESLVRFTSDRSEQLYSDFKYNLSEDAAKEVMEFFIKTDSELFDSEINEYLSEEVLHSDFWKFFSSLFAFRNDHSALEVKKYMQRYMQHLDKMANGSMIKYPERNQYESMILPIFKWLHSQGVNFRTGSVIKEIEMDAEDGEATAKRIIIEGKPGKDGEPSADEIIEIGPNDLLFIETGDSKANARTGSQNEPAEYTIEPEEGGSWEIWKKVCVIDNRFGNPDKFLLEPERTCLVTATFTTIDEKVPQYIKSISRRDPFGGECVTGGPVTIIDSPWKMSWSMGRQPQFRGQKEDQTVGWIYGLEVNVEGDYIKKPMIECTGKEIAMEWLYHLGVPKVQIEEMATDSLITNPRILPFMTSFFIPRATGDWPSVRPKGCTNFAFIGQFARTGRDVCFTTEYSVRTGMEAVYSLLEIDRGIPEVWGSVYDLREVIQAIVTLRDGRSTKEMSVSHKGKKMLKELSKQIEGTELEWLFEKYGLKIEL